MNGEVEIRIARKEELHKLAPILEELEPDDYLPNVIQEWIERESVFIAFVHEAAAGMSHFEHLPDGSIWLSGLRVGKSWRRTGIGGALTRFATTMPGETVFRLMISDINIASISVTEKAGFRRRSSVSLWQAENGANILPGFSPANVLLDEMEHIGMFGGLLPTAWLAFDPRTADKRDLERRHLSFVQDRLGSVFLLNEEARALTPMHLENRASLNTIPSGYILLAEGGEKLDSTGLKQTLWTKGVGIYEFRKNDYKT